MTISLDKLLLNLSILPAQRFGLFMVPFFSYTMIVSPSRNSTSNSTSNISKDTFSHPQLIKWQILHWLAGWDCTAQTHVRTTSTRTANNEKKKVVRLPYTYVEKKIE